MKKHSISFEAIIVAIVMLIMLTLVFLGVISRYVLHFSFSFTEELVCAMFVLLSTMGGALTSKENSHFTLDLITGLMRPKMKKAFTMIDAALTGAAALALMYTGLIMVRSQMRIGSLSVALKIPNWVYGSFVPIGLAFILFRSIQFIIKTGRKTGEGDQ